MQKVGGFTDYLALCGDVRSYGDVLIILAGESEAEQMRQLERQLGG